MIHKTLCRKQYESHKKPGVKSGAAISDTCNFYLWNVSLNLFFQDRANNLFKQVSDGKALKGRSNDAIAAACMYIACRQEGVPRTFKGQSLRRVHWNQCHVY